MLFVYDDGRPHLAATGAAIDPVEPASAIVSLLVGAALIGVSRRRRSSGLVN